MGNYCAQQLYKGLYFVYDAERKPPFIAPKSVTRYELHSVHLFSDRLFSTQDIP